MNYATAAGREKLRKIFISARRKNKNLDKGGKYC